MDNYKDLKEIIERQAALNQKLAAMALELDTVKERLAAYEDTGLEPEEVRAQKGLFDYIAPDCDLSDGVRRFQHFRELVQAEKAGRLVVLPCKVGDTVYLTYGDCVIEAEVTCIRPFVFKDKTEFRGNAAWRYEDPFYNDGRILEQDMFIVFGKTAFLIREEAEAALKGGAE